MARGADLEADLDIFIGQVCADWEFGNQPTAAALLKDRRELSSLAFAKAILEADGMRPDREPSWMRRLKRRFAQHYRGDAISPEGFAEEAWDDR